MCSYFSKITPQITIFMSFSYNCLPCRDFAGKFRSILFVIDLQWKANKKVGLLASQRTPTLQSLTATSSARYLYFLIHRNCLNAECQPASSYRACKSGLFLVFTVNIAVFPRDQAGVKNCQKIEIQYALKRKGEIPHTIYYVNANNNCRISHTLRSRS